MLITTATEFTNGTTDHPQALVASMEIPEKAFHPLYSGEISTIFNIAIANALSVATQQCYQEAKSRRGHK